MARNPYWTASDAARMRSLDTWRYPDGTMAFTPSTSTYYENFGYTSQSFGAYEIIDIVSVNLRTDASYNFIASGTYQMDISIYDRDGYLLQSVDGDDIRIYDRWPEDSIIGFRPDYSGIHYISLTYRYGAALGTWNVAASEDIGADYRNTSTAPTPPTPPAPPTTPTPPTTPVVRGVDNDFNGDGSADILWFNNDTRTVAIWTMNGTSRTGAAAIQSTISPGWEVSGSGDFNGDRMSDILFRHTGSGDLAIWTMNGLSRTAGAVIQDGGLPSSTRVAGVADTNGDGMSDIILHDTNGDVTIWLMNGTSRQSIGVVQRGVNTAWKIAGTGDFNGDGNADILWQRTDTGLTAVWTMNGTTRLAGETIQETVDRSWSIQAVGDLNGDGNDDIVWRHTDGRLAAWHMNGTTRLNAGVISGGPLASDWSVVDAADFNGDGRDDLLVRDTTTGGTSVLTLDGMTRTGSSVLQSSGNTSWQVASGYADPLLRA